MKSSGPGAAVLVGVSGIFLERKHIWQITAFLTFFQGDFGDCPLALLDGVGDDGLLGQGLNIKTFHDRLPRGLGCAGHLGLGLAYSLGVVVQFVGALELLALTVPHCPLLSQHRLHILT